MEESPEGFERLELQEVQSIPVPSEVPSAPDLSHLPTHVLRSGAVESLIQQNDDIMARLAVSLRRVSLLEGKISEYELEKKELLEDYNNFRDQVLILREKSRVLSERHKNEDENLATFKEQVRLREIQYAELYSSSQIRQEELETKIHRLTRKLSVYFRYREFVQQQVIRLASDHENQINLIENQRITELKDVEERHIKEIAKWQYQLQETRDNDQHQIRHSSDTIKETQIRIEDLENSLEDTQRRLNEALASSERIKRDLGDAADHIKNQAKESGENLDQVVRQYEQQITGLNKNIVERENQISELKDHCENYDRHLEKNVELENQVVAEQRRGEESRIRLETEVEDLQKSLARYRGEAKAKTLEVENLRQDLVKTHNEFMDTKTGKDTLEEQVENLQCLWRENQNELEKEKEKSKALQKINQQLSVKMNGYRQQINELKRQLDSAQIQTAERVKELRSQVKAVAQLQPAQSTDSSQEQAEFHPDLMNKIDSLIDEIHGAFNNRQDPGDALNLEAQDQDSETGETTGTPENSGNDIENDGASEGAKLPASRNPHLTV